MASKIEEGVRKGMLAALGIAAVTKEKAQQVVQELIKKGEMSKKDVTIVTKSLLEKTKVGRDIIGSTMEKMIKKAVERLNVPTKKEFNELKKEVAALKRKRGKSRSK